MHSAWSTRICFSSSGVTKISVSSGVFIALVKPARIPFARMLQVALGDPVILLGADADVELEMVIADRLLGVGDLALAARFEVAQERVAHRRGIEAGRREAVEQDVAFLERHQPRLPLGRDRAFLGQQRPRSELEDDLAELGIVDPVVPLVEPPDAAGHDDRHAVGDAAARASSRAAP